MMLGIGSASAAESPKLDAAAAVFPQTQPRFTANAVRILGGENGNLVSSPGPVFTQGGDYTGMTLPELISVPEPIKYPRWAVTQGWEGEFVIAIEVLLDGTVGRYAVMQSTGYNILDEVATSAVKSWKFTPAKANGEAIVTCVEIPVQFRLVGE